MRPTTLLKNNTLYWTIRTYNTSGVLTDADSTPTVAVLKNGSATGDSVTPSKRTATTGIYDCSYNPASEVEGDTFTIEESATVGGTAGSWNWSCVVVDAYALASKVIGTIASGTHNPQSGDAYARLGAPAGASVSADIAAVLALASSAATAAAAAETAAEAAQSAVDGLDVIPAAQAGNQVSGSALSLCRGTTITINLSDLGDLSDRTKLWVTGKYNVADPDSAAIFQVEETAGLLRIGGAAPVTGETATLTVTDEVAGDVTVEIGAAAAAKLRLVSDGVYDAKWRNSDGEVIATAATALSISGDVTRATS